MHLGGGNDLEGEAMNSDYFTLPLTSTGVSNETGGAAFTSSTQQIRTTQPSVHDDSLERVEPTADGGLTSRGSFAGTGGGTTDSGAGEREIEKQDREYEREERGTFRGRVRTRGWM
jgi:hypothetical protein